MFNPFAAAWQVGIVEPEACAEQPAALSSREPEPLCAEGPAALLVEQPEASVQGKAIDEDQEYMFDLDTLIFETNMASPFVIEDVQDRFDQEMFCTLNCFKIRQIVALLLGVAVKFKICVKQQLSNAHV